MPNKVITSMFFKQIQQHTDNFSYIVADENTKEAAVVDSSYNADEIIKAIKNEKLHLKYIINTHGHSDHTAGNTELQSIFGAKIVAHKQSKIILTSQLMKTKYLTLGKSQ